MKITEIITENAGRYSSSKIIPDAAFIGYLSPDHKFETFTQRQAADADYHHSFLVKDLDAYDAEGGLTFVRYGGKPIISIKGTPAIDPYDQQSSAMISELARKIIKSGANSDMPIVIENMGFSRTEAPYQGKQIGTLLQWAMRNEKKPVNKELDEACWKGYHKEGNKKMFGKTYPNCVKNESQEEVEEGTASGDHSLHDWFSKSKSSDGKPGWVQIGGRYAGKPCAKQPGQKTKPKCGSSKMRRAMSDKEEDAAARRKRKQDPNPNRSGAAKMVNTKPKK
jgi:hypothetical protein